MGVKGTLSTVAMLNIGLEDTLACYTAEGFATGLKKTLTLGTLSVVATLNSVWGDTLADYMVEEFVAGFKKTLAFQPRVAKQTRGSSGERI